MTELRYKALGVDLSRGGEVGGGGGEGGDKTLTREYPSDTTLDTCRVTHGDTGGHTCSFVSVRKKRTVVIVQHEEEITYSGLRRTSWENRDSCVDV